MQRAQATVNEDRLFRLLPNFFRSPSAMLLELAQNAARAGANRLSVSLDGNLLRAEDDGPGTDNLRALVVLADSDWDDAVESSQTPAGWGLFFLLCLSSQVEIRSRFGAIRIDCDRFLSDRAYRLSLLEAPSDPTPRTGFSIAALLKPEFCSPDARGRVPVLERAADLGFFPVETAVNGKDVPARTALDLKGENDRHEPDFTADYMGNEVHVRIGNGAWLRPDRFDGDVAALWHGFPVKGRLNWYVGGAVIDVRTGAPVTPVLPYREALKSDDKLAALREFLRRETVRHCAARIDRDCDDPRRIDALCDAMAEIATDDELSALTRFAVETEVSEGRSSARRIVVLRRGDEVPADEDLEALIDIAPDGTRTESELPSPILAPGAPVTSVFHAKRLPDWLSIPRRTLHVEVRHDGAPYDGHHHWQKASSIAVVDDRGGSREIAYLALNHDYHGLAFYYADAPDAVLDADEAFFETAVESEDSDADSRETQWTDFQNRLFEDLADIRGEYPLGDLLRGLTIAKVPAAKVKSLSVDRRRNAMTVHLVDGKTTVLRLA